VNKKEIEEMRKNHPLKKVMHRLNQIDLDEGTRIEILSFLVLTESMEWMDTPKGIRDWQKQLNKLANG
tara:strand:+ start:366 stop:569 length:204 start_codon:yes stop_codon:yes gene_type:complete